MFVTTLNMGLSQLTQPHQEQPNHRNKQGDGTSHVNQTIGKRTTNNCPSGMKICTYTHSKSVV